MSTIVVNKPEAARRQINMAINLLFDDEDPIPIHTLAMAGFRIVRDLIQKVPSHQTEDSLTLLIKPGMEREFWKVIHRPSNFFKHADLDPYEVLRDVKDEMNDIILLWASIYYQELGNELSPEMRAWVSVLHPNLMRDDSTLKNLANRPEMSLFKKGTRSEKLEMGKIILELTRQS